MDEDDDLFNPSSESLEELSQYVSDREGVFDLEHESCIPIIHKAIQAGCESAVEDLLLIKTNLEAENIFGETPLMVAVRNCNKTIVEMLIEKGADVNAEDDHSNTPLMRAVESNSETIVTLLLKNGASCLVENARCQTPLILAINLNFESVFDLLVEGGADVAMENSQYDSPLRIALEKVNVKLAKKLLDKGAHMTSADVFYALFNCYAPSFEILFDFVVENGFDVNTIGFDDWSVLHVAVWKQSQTVVKKLLERAADIGAKCITGDTPLHLAAKFQPHKIAMILLDHGADVNAMNVKGQTPLSFAINMCNTDVVQLLLNAGALMSSEIRNNPVFRTSPRKIKGLLLNARKMQLAKMQVNLSHNDRKCPKGFTSIDDFEADCLNELEVLKAVKFGRICLWNVLTDNDPVYANNLELQDYIVKETLGIDFPQYAHLLRRAFTEGMKRNILMDKLSPCFQLITCSTAIQLVLPNEISRKVLSYLQYNDLLNVQKAFGNITSNT